jgi:hypothetical protein
VSRLSLTRNSTHARRIASESMAAQVVVEGRYLLYGGVGGGARRCVPSYSCAPTF